MASRLTRWGVAAGLGVIVVFVVTLPPGPSVLPGSPRYWQDPGPSGAAGIYRANSSALSRASFDLNKGMLREGLHRLIPAGPAPVVARIDSGRKINVGREAARTAAAESLWQSLPRAADAPRIVLFGTFEAQYARDVTEFTKDLCVASYAPVRGPRQAALRRYAGACALAYQFGLPGAPMRAWLDEVGQVSFADTPRRTAGRGVVHRLDTWGSLDEWRYGPDRIWSLSRELEACAGGRQDRCAPALGFAAHQRTTTAHWSQYRGGGSTAELPAALLADLGPERFAILWRGNDPVPEAYRRLSGRSFDLWAMNYVQDAVGRLEKENGLSLLGWACWLLWMGLLLGWFAARMEQRSAT